MVRVLDEITACPLAVTLGLTTTLPWYGAVIDGISLIEGRRYHLPDGSERFLVDEEMLRRETESLGGQLLEPFKTVVVHHQRAMSNWILRKR